MPRFQPRDPGYLERVANVFMDESITFNYGGELESVSPGGVEIALSFRNAFADGPHLLHRSIVAALLDDACVLAALSLASPGDRVSTAEYKLNFLAAAEGGGIVVRAEVLRPGRSITVCRADAVAGDTLVARMLATLAVSRPV